MENNITIESACKRWQSLERPLFKGSLIDDSGCCCAQGDVLRFSGYSDEQLRNITQTFADKEVAKLLGISVTHSILLRQVNDKKDGCPQDVLSNPSKILGFETARILKFWKWADNNFADAAAAYADAYADAAAYAAAYAKRWYYYRFIRGSTMEIVGHTKLKKLYFLPRLGFENVEALDKLPE